MSSPFAYPPPPLHPSPLQSHAQTRVLTSKKPHLGPIDNPTQPLAPSCIFYFNLLQELTILYQLPGTCSRHKLVLGLEVEHTRRSVATYFAGVVPLLHHFVPPPPHPPHASQVRAAPPTPPKARVTDDPCHASDILFVRQ